MSARASRAVRPRGLQVTVARQSGRPSAPGLARWLARAAPARVQGTVAIALIGDAEMRRLNSTFLGRDYPTDVLSFPHAALEPGRHETPGDVTPPDHRAAQARKRLQGNYLGDIAIAQGVARRQAREHGHALATEVRILALHGLLHLLGYDHERDRGAMHRIEDRLRRRAGLPPGLIGRRPAAKTSR